MTVISLFQEIASATYRKFEHLGSKLTTMDRKVKQLQVGHYWYRQKLSEICPQELERGKERKTS